MLYTLFACCPYQFQTPQVVRTERFDDAASSIRSSFSKMRYSGGSFNKVQSCGLLGHPLGEFNMAQDRAEFRDRRILDSSHLRESFPPSAVISKDKNRFKEGRKLFEKRRIATGIRERRRKLAKKMGFTIGPAREGLPFLSPHHFARSLYA